MKTIHLFLSVLIFCGFMAVSGCGNTAHGMHSDWQQNTQSIANATGN
ncbi:MAG: hypothetical protein P4M14_06490 [Gammaproteobacteria bacterium]|nr:hypothetical protein [Gammaproteobacteria bacterium]